MKKEINIVICDDEKEYLNYLYNVISDYMNKEEIICNIIQCQSGEDFVKVFHELKNIDMVFLDINMYEMDGFSVADFIRCSNQEVFIVFISSYEGYAVSGYYYNALRFIVKNKNEKKYIEECLRTFISICDKNNNKEFIITNKNNFNVIELTKIVYIESRGHDVIIHYKDNDKSFEVKIREKLDSLENDLSNSKQFIRIHKSFLINLNYLDIINEKKVIMLNGVELPISRSYYKDVIFRFMKYKGRIDE